MNKSKKKNWRTDFDWRDKNDHPVNYNEVETSFSQPLTKAYKEMCLPHMVSKYMQKKYNISDKLIEALLKAKNLEINYENKKKEIGVRIRNRAIQMCFTQGRRMSEVWND